MTFRVEYTPEARSQYYALPSGLFQWVRAEMDALAEVAGLLMPAGRDVPPRAARRALPGRLELDALVVQYAVDWQARVLRVEQLAVRPSERTG